MKAQPKTIFRFRCGGFFSGYDTVEVLGTDAGYKLRCEHGPLNARETLSDLSESQVKNLKQFVDSEIRGRWYCRYENANVLDGTQWELYDGYLERHGSNLFPQGFGKLVRFLSNEFGCEDLGKHGDVFASELNEQQELAILASYSSWLPDPECLENHDDESDEDAEDKERCVEMVVRQFSHDLQLFVDHYPRYRDYGRTLKENGIPLDVEQMKSHDVRDADPECIVAMLLAVFRADHFDGRSDRFRTCAKDGMFVRWLRRLEEALG